MSSYPLSTSTSSSAWGPGYIPSSIGYTDRIQEQWSREFDPTRLHKNEISGGPMTKSYENLGISNVRRFKYLTKNVFLSPLYINILISMGSRIYSFKYWLHRPNTRTMV
uniref:Uncharacterized protein n=1 Tax=Meloidogyne incognita TaxID=6306 RepID=A0A914N895_MELIC